MAAILNAGRAAKGRRPAGRLTINHDSPQAAGLVELLMGTPWPYTEVLHRTQTQSGTFDAPRATYEPLPDVFLHFNEAGGNQIWGLVTSGVNYGATTDPFSVTCWLFRTQAPNAKRSVWILGFDGLGATHDWSFGLASNATGNLGGSVVTTSGGAARFDTGASSTAVGAFAWYHAALVWNPGTGLTLYVNGRSEATNGTATTTVRDLGSMRIYGCGSNNDIGGFSGIDGGWDGALADVRIYRRALTATEVWALYAPQSRWDLYWVPGRRVYVSVSAAPAFKAAWAVRPSRVIGTGVI